VPRATGRKNRSKTGGVRNISAVAKRRVRIKEVGDEVLEEVLAGKIARLHPVVSIDVENEEKKGLERKEWWERTDFFVVPHKGRYYIVEAIESGYEEWYDTTRVKHNESGYETINIYEVEGDVKEALKDIAWGTWNAYYQQVKEGEYKEIHPASPEDLMEEIDDAFETAGLKNKIRSAVHEAIEQFAHVDKEKILVDYYSDNYIVIHIPRIEKQGIRESIESKLKQLGLQVTNWEKLASEIEITLKRSK